MEAALTFPPIRMPSPRPIPATESADGDSVDVALMKRIADGDERAFRELVERHQNAVVGTVKLEMHRQIDRAIATLPEAQRTAVILYSYESLPYEEIAGVLNTSVSSVKSLLFRARTTLREKLATYLAE